jgi:hypothetical protein
MEQRGGADLNWADHGGVCFTVAETWFGESLKFELVGDWLGAILVGVVRDNVVELAAGSIYRRSERWWSIWPSRAGGRRWGRTRVRWIRVHRRGELTGDDWTAVASHGVVVESKATRRKAGRRRFTGEVSRSGRGNLVRWSDLFNGRSLSTARIFTRLRVLSDYQLVRISTAATIPAQGHRRRGVRLI